MIKANELRIGNLVALNVGSSKGDICKVRTTHDCEIKVHHKNDFVECDYLCCEPSDLAPIPLTPEIFIHAGFSYKKMPFDGTMGFCKEGDQYFIGFAQVKDGWSFHNPHFDMRIQYVHQLQNLFFALTGIELTIAL